MKHILLFACILIGSILRLYHLGGNPPSLYWDEASLGYNAYSIATSGKDEHGEMLPLDRFIAFGDYKPPGYIYSIVPFIYAYGLNEVSVRLPSAFAGIGMIIGTYFLVHELFSRKKISLLAAFLVAVSPWSIQLSRGAFEANLAALFNMLGIYFYLLATQRKWTICLSVLFFLLSFYTFNANRIIAPLLFSALCILNWKQVRDNMKWFLMAVVAGCILLLPSFNYLMDRESRLRLQEVSIFTNPAPVEIANERIARMGGNVVAKIIHNRRVLFFSEFLKHYTDNFSGRFLFTHGDGNPRLSVQDMGELSVWELPFLVIGCIFFIIRKERNAFLVLLWSLIAPIPGGMARETPHALRIASILPTFQIITAFGFYHFFIYVSHLSFPRRRESSRVDFLSGSRSRLRQGFDGRGKSGMTGLILCSLFFVSFYYYLHMYHVHYPKDWSGEWQYGYKEMVNYITRVQNDYDHIYVTPAYGRPYIYFAFYQQYPNDAFLRDKKASRDWFGFWEVSSLGNISFDPSQQLPAAGRVLFVETPRNVPSGYNILKTIKNLAGDTVFVIAER